MSSESVVLEPRLHQPVRSFPQKIHAGFLAFVGFLLTSGLMVVGYQWSGQTVTLTIDGQTRQFRTHQPTVAHLLESQHIRLRPQDIVTPPLDTSLSITQTITIQRARAVTLLVDGEQRVFYTHAASPAAVLLEAGITLNPYDRVTVNHKTLVPENPFPREGPVVIRIHRAVPFTISYNHLRAQLWTTAPTVGEALAEKKIPIYLADVVNVPLDTPMSAGMNVILEQSQPVRILVDGQEIRTRTRAETVADVLEEAGITLRPLDYTIPPTDAILTPNQVIDIRRVDETFVYEDARIPYETVWKADPNMEIDTQRLIQNGSPGVRRRRTRIVYENNEEVARETTSWWVAQPPKPEVRAYGTKIVWRTVETPAGPKRYWRKIRVLATSYSAATSGKSRSHPAYGITRLGWEAGRGIVAVDPKVINMRQKMYVPGYGMAVAGDTGGKIKGKHIDLGFPEDELELWYHWVDVYLLEPLPPKDKIPYILPNWPPERK